MNIEQFIREAFSRQNDLSGVFFSSFSFSVCLQQLQYTTGQIFPPDSKLNQNYIANNTVNSVNNGIINGLLAGKVNGRLCFELGKY